MDIAFHQHDCRDSAEVRQVLQIAARAGLLTDLLPRPFGSAPVTQFRYPIAWYQALRGEELAWGCGGLMLLLSAHHLGAAPLVFSGEISSIRRFMLPAYRETKQGRPHLFAYAITEPAAGSDAEESHGASLARPGTVAQHVEGGWSLSGRKLFISGGDLARSITVFAALEGEGFESWTCFLVKHDMPGFQVARTELKMGMRVSGAAELVFEDVFVPEDRVIGGLRNGWALNRAILNTSRIPVGGMAVGFARAAADAAIAFACRHRLGRKALIHYQEIQLMLAQMIAETAAIRSLVWQVARSSYVPRQDQSAISKFHASDRAVKVCEMAMELMGNHGMLHHNRAEKIYRDARLTQIFEGTNQINMLAVIEDQQEFLLAQTETPVA
jgi:alkylation response protein AidB-like acyl-CoA dehydrogenase